MSKIVEDYVLLEVIGRGMFGEVFKAVRKDAVSQQQLDQQLQQQFLAVKMFERAKLQSSREWEDVLVDEIQCLRRTSNQRIVQFYRWVQTSKHVYLVYEYCAGGTLDELLKKHSTLDEEYSLKIVFNQLLEGCISLRNKGILHRDLKPCNILFKDEQHLEVKIADFGFASLTNHRKAYSQNSRGSPIYMAPELLRGGIPDFSCDVYSLGVILYEITQGRCPFEDTVLESLLEKKEKTQIIFLRPISPFVQDLIRDMLNVNPLFRPTVDELAARLQAYNPNWCVKQTIGDDKITKNTLKPQEPMMIQGKFDSFIQKENISQKYGTIDGYEEERKQLRLELCLSEVGNEAAKNQLESNKYQHIGNTPQSEQTKKIDADKKILEVSLKILKERNKIVYVNNVVSAVIDVNASQQSSLVVLILMKQMLNLTRQLISQMKSSELTSFKISTSHWSKFRMTADYEYILETLSNEQRQIENNFQIFLGLLPPDERTEFDAIDDSMSGSTTNFAGRFHQLTNSSSSPSSLSSPMHNPAYCKVLRDYCLTLLSKAHSISAANSPQVGFRILMHLNNILDGFDIDAFFAAFISETIKRLSLQTYFTVIQSLSYDDLSALVTYKLDAMI